MPNRGVHRGVYSSLVDSPEFQSLTPHARLVFLTARVCKQTGPAAIFVCYREVLARQTGLKVRQVEEALRELEDTGWIRCEGLVVWLVNGLRYDPTMRLANPKHRKAVLRALEELPRTGIVVSFCEYYRLEWLPDSLSDTYPKLAPPNTEEDRGVPRGTSRDPILTTLSGDDPPDPAPPGIPKPPRAPNPYRVQAIEVLEFLNRKTGRRYEPVPANLSLIAARLREGATVGQCRGVIVQRWRLWRDDPKMAEYIRPATLFNAAKFSQYKAHLPEPEPTNGQ